ncbi:methyltransferase domain-containing protein [Siccirubricoccus sp. KC 17139]|uniref:Methyltransferase domain-containing protein n=1 Tax=Siccirubricoccus soli TaxID=2899147 RepID=A0ABT1D1R6_9PROT|nr:methyltransferase domain-containing protein [Siccirubricoccus soli]MCO6415255.1 methyltransferase domain-containing protein [Siccirubricoccus soli]MCP2681386.1 methyltransferase domain-containing protein [Siccirubricoccus soli]
MAGWLGSYVTETPYIPNFSASQSPAHLALACAIAGVHWAPDREALTILDLGCGRGGSLLALAAANPGWTVVGLDYNPAHIAEAREMAAEAGLANARFLELDLIGLDEAAAAAALPEADVVTLHGMWTWVSDPVREGILAVLRSRVQPGGLVMLGYNALPGWAGDLALARLMREVARHVPGPADARAATAFAAAQALHGVGALALRNSMVIQDFLGGGSAASFGWARYLAHEFLPESWRPAFPLDVAAEMGRAKLDFVGQVKLWRNFPELWMTPEQRKAVEALPPGVDPGLVQEMFGARQPLREDIFVRGRRPAAPEALGAMRLALARQPAQGVVQIDTGISKARLPPEVAEKLLGALAEKPRRLDELLPLAEGSGLAAAELATFLVSSHAAVPVWRENVSGAAQARSRKYNAMALERWGGELQEGSYAIGLAVPRLGGPLILSAEEGAIAMILAQAGKATPEPAAVARALIAAGLPVPPEEAEKIVAGVMRSMLGAWRGMGLI